MRICKIFNKRLCIIYREIRVKVMDGSKQDLCFAQKPCQDWKTKSFKRSTA